MNRVITRFRIPLSKILKMRRLAKKTFYQEKLYKGAQMDVVTYKFR